MPKCAFFSFPFFFFFPFPFFFFFPFLLRCQQSMKMGKYVRNSPTLYSISLSHCVLAVAEQQRYSPMQPGKRQAPCPTRLMTGLGLSQQHPGFVNAGPRNLLIR